VTRGTGVNDFVRAMPPDRSGGVARIAVLRTLGRVEAGLESPLGTDLRAWMQRAKQADLERVDVEALVKAVMDEIFEGGLDVRLDTRTSEG